MTERLDFRVDIEKALKTTGLSSNDFKLVNPYEYEKVLVAILDKFTTLGKKGLNCSWLWNSFKDPKSSIQLDYPPPYLKKLVALEEKVWFVAENQGRTKQHGNFWLYEGKVATIIDILGEMYSFEYYIVSKKFEWLLCENHHEILIGVGSSMVERIEQLRSTFGKAI